MYAGNLILKTKECEMRINTELIGKKSLCELEKLVNKLDLDTEEAILLSNIEARTENAQNVPGLHNKLSFTRKSSARKST